MNKQLAMDKLCQEILDKNICSELASSATQLVMGEGNLDAKILLVGEAPGKQEDLAGQPFIGASGKFLNEMLSSINLERDEVYITNIVKYRPPNNRDPRPTEKAEFGPYLLKQIQIIQPLVVVSLGRHALGFFDADVSIADVHGQIRSIKLDGYDLTLLALYHPAAALYNGKLRQTLRADFQILKQFLDSGH